MPEALAQVCTSLHTEHGCEVLEANETQTLQRKMGTFGFCSSILTSSPEPVAQATLCQASSGVCFSSAEYRE